MPNEENLLKLYNALGDEYDLGSYDDFKVKMQDSNNRSKLWSAANADYDLGDFNAFEQRIGYTGGLGKPAPGSEAGASGGRRLPSKLNVQQVKTYLGKYGASFTDDQYRQIAEQAAGKSLEEAMSIARNITTPTPKVTPMAPLEAGRQMLETAAAKRTGLADQVQAQTDEMISQRGYLSPEQLQGEAMGQGAILSATIPTMEQQRVEFATGFRKEGEAEAAYTVAKMRPISKKSLLAKYAEEAREKESDEIDLGPFGSVKMGDTPEEAQRKLDQLITLGDPGSAEADFGFSSQQIYDQLKSNLGYENDKKLEEDLLKYFKTNEGLKYVIDDSKQKLSLYNQQYEQALQDPQSSEEDLVNLKQMINKELQIQNMGDIVESTQYDRLSLGQKTSLALAYGANTARSLLGSLELSAQEFTVGVLEAVAEPFLAPEHQGMTRDLFLAPILSEKKAAQEVRASLPYQSISSQSVLDGLNLLNFSTTATQVVGSIAATYAGGAMGGAALVYGDAVDEARKSGFGRDESKAYGLLNAVISGYLEKIGLKGMTKTIVSDAERRYVLSAIRSELKKGASVEKVVSIVTNKITNSLGSLMKAGTPEGVTEFAQTGQEILLKKGFNSIVLDDDKKGFEEPSLDEAAKMLTESFVVGFFSTGSVPSLISAFSKGSAKYEDAAKAVVDGKRKVSDIVETTKGLILSGKVSAADGRAFIENLKIAEASKAALPKYVKDKQQRTRAISLMMERNKLTEEMNSSDPDLQDGYNKRLTEIKQELKSIADKNWVAPTNPFVASTAPGFSAAMNALSQESDTDKAARTFNKTVGINNGLLTKLTKAMESNTEIAANLAKTVASDLEMFVNKLSSMDNKTPAMQEAIKSATDIMQKLNDYGNKRTDVSTATVGSLNMDDIIGRIAAGVDPADMDFMENVPEETLLQVADALSGIQDGMDVSEKDAAAASDFLYDRYKQLTDLKAKVQKRIDSETNQTKKDRLTRSLSAINEAQSKISEDINTAVKYQQEKALRDETAGTRTQPVVSPLSGPKEEAAPEAAQTQQAQEYDPANEQEVVDDFNSKNEDQLLPGVVRAMNAVAKLLAKIAPEVKFYVHTTTQDFVSALEADGMSKTAAKNSSGDTGRYISFRGKAMSVHINLEAVNREAIEKGEASRAIYHEAAHVILNKFFGSNPGVIKDMLSAVTKVIPKGVSKKIDEFITSYEGDTDEVINEERIVELVEILAATEQQLDNTTISKIIKAINDFIERAANALGVKDVEKFLISNNRADFVDFVNSMARSTASGIQEISPETTKRIQKRYAVQEQAEPAELANEEATTKALVEIGIYGDEDQRGKFYSFIDEFYPDGISYEELSNEYHKAKKDGSNPELVKAVEKLITESQVSTKASKAKSEGKEKITTLADETRARQPEQARDRAGRIEGRSLTPLEGAPIIQGASGPDPRLVAVAEKYAKENGIDLKRQSEYVSVDVNRARRIADAYDKLKSDPKNPKVREAYADLVKQTLAQYKALQDAGYEFSFFDSNSDPYNGNPWDAMRDLRKNKRMAVYGTYDGYGTDGITASEVENNPMLEDTGLRWKDQDGVERPVLANDLFRAVHDAFGHGLEGTGFRARGEENAWQAHVRLFTGPAVAAITTETRGQNSWLNYGPFGENNRTAKLEDTVFAENKIGLLPEWTWTEGRAGDMQEGKPGIETKASKSSLANDGTGVVLSGNETLEKGENASTVSIKKGDYIDDYSTDDIQSSTHASNSRVVSLASNLAYGKITYTKDKEKITLELPYKNLTQFNKLKSLKDQYRAIQGASKAAKEQKQKLKSEINKLAKTVISDFTDLMTQNLLALYDTLTPDFIKNSKEWYIGANRMAGAIGKKYKMSIEQVSGVIAVLSPQNDWFNNVSVAERTIEIMSNYADTKITQDIVDKAVAYNTKKGKEPNDFAKLLLEFFKENGEMSINDMDAIGDGESQALILRAIDQAIHSPKVAMTDPTGKFVGYDKTPVRWNSSDEISKAILIYKNGDIKSINENLGNGNKVRNFYNNIVDPNSETPYVTADTHALSAALNSPISANDAGGLGLFNGSLEPLYAMVKGAYINAAKIAGVMPREMQSITWEAQRIGINNKNRTEEAKNKIFDYLKESRQNKQTPYERATELIARNRSTNPGWGESRGVETQKSSDEIRSDVKARADSRISSLSDLRGRSKRGVGKPSSEVGGRAAEGKADTEGKPGIETKASKARAKIEPKYDPDDINQGKPQLDLQTRIYDAAAEVWADARTKSEFDKNNMIRLAVFNSLGIDLGDIELATLAKDLFLGKRPEYKRSDTGKYERVKTRKDRSAVLTRVINALSQMATDRRANKSIIESLLNAVKGDTTYTVENQVEAEMIVDEIFKSVNGVADIETGNALLALAMNANGGIRAVMFGRIANEAWEKARQAKDLEVRKAYRELGNLAMGTLSSEATENGRFNSMIYRIQKMNPEFIVEFEVNKVRNQTANGIRENKNKRDEVVSTANELNNAQAEAAQQATQAPSVQAAVNAATGTPNTQPQTPPTQKSKTQKQAQQQTNTSSPKPNAQVDNRIKELKGLLKNKFGGIQSKAARTAPAGLDPDILDIITELAENYIKKGITDPTALIAKVNADVVAAGGSLSSAYYNQMWSNVSTAATAMQNDMNASSLAGRIVGRVKQRIMPSPVSFDPIAELIDELLNKATEDLTPLPKKTPESRLDKLTRLISQYYDAKDMWEASKAKVEQRIDDLDPMKFSAADKQAMKDMLDKFFANDLSYFEIKKTPTPGAATTVDKMIREQMKEKKLAIEKILLEANTKQAQTKDEFIDQIVADIVAATGITSARATAIARSFADQYDRIVTKKQESIIKKKLPVTKAYSKFRQKSTAQRAFEAIKYGMIDPSIRIYDEAGNIIDTTKLFCEMFGIPYVDDTIRAELDKYAEAIAEAPVGILRNQVLNDMAMFIKMQQYLVQGSIGQRFISDYYAKVLTSMDSMMKAFNSNILVAPIEYTTQAVRSAAKGDFSLIPILTRAYYGKKGVGKMWTEKATTDMTDPDGFKINAGEDYYKLKDGSIISLSNPKVAALSSHYNGLLRYSTGINNARLMLRNIIIGENFSDNSVAEVYRKYGSRSGRVWGTWATLASRGFAAIDAMTTAAATQARFGDLIFDAVKFYARDNNISVSGREVADIVNRIQGTKPLIQLDALSQAISEMEQKYGAKINLKDKAKMALLLARAEEIVKDKMSDRRQEVVTAYPWLSMLDDAQLADMLNMSYDVASKIGMMGMPPGTGGLMSSILGFPGKYIAFSNIQYGMFRNAPINAAQYILMGNSPIATLMTVVRLVKNKRGFSFGLDFIEKEYKNSGIRTEMYGKQRGKTIKWNLEKQDLLTKFILIQAPVVVSTYMAANAVIAAIASTFDDDDEEKERLMNDGAKAIGTIDQRERLLKFFGDPLSKDPKKREGVWKTIPFYTTGALYGMAKGGYAKNMALKATYGIEQYCAYSYGKKIFSYRDNPALGAFLMQMSATTDAMLFTEKSELSETQHGIIMASTFAQLNLIKDQSNLRSIAELTEFLSGQRAYEGADGFFERLNIYKNKTLANIINNAVVPAEIKNIGQDINAVLDNYLDDPRTFTELVVYRWPIISNIFIDKDKSGPFGLPLEVEPKRVFPIGLEQFKLPLMENGTLEIPDVDKLMSSKEREYVALFMRNNSDKFLNPDMSGYYKLNDYKEFVRETFTDEQRKMIRDEYKVVMREFAEKNMRVNTPLDFDVKLNLFLNSYKRKGYKRYILNKVLGEEAKSVLIDESDAIVNMKSNGLLVQKLRDAMKDFEPRE